MFSERSAIFEINVLFPEYLLSLKYMLLYFTKDFFIRLTSPTDTKSAMLKLIKQQSNKHQDLLSCYTTLNTASIIKQKEFFFYILLSSVKKNLVYIVQYLSILFTV